MIMNNTATAPTKIGRGMGIENAESLDVAEPAILKNSNLSMLVSKIIMITDLACMKMKNDNNADKFEGRDNGE